MGDLKEAAVILLLLAIGIAWLIGWRGARRMEREGRLRKELAAQKTKGKAKDAAREASDEDLAKSLTRRR